MVSDWSQHRDEAVGSVCQRKSTELVEGVLYVGSRGKQPFEVFLIHTLWKESDHSKKVASVGAEFAECGGS